MHTDFVIEQPRHLSDALEILGADDPMVRPLAGGTGLVVLLKFDVMPVTTLVDLGRVAPELSGISVTEAGGARLGAMATLGRLQRSRELLTAYPILEQVLQVLASTRIRNVAQLGGALAHAHPQMDLPPVLVALGARVRARSRNGERWIDIDDLIVGYYETCLRSDELIVEVELPPPGRHRGIYRKVTERTADDWPMLGVAAVASPGDSGPQLRVALGGIRDRPVRLHRLETTFAAGALDSDSIGDVVADVADDLDYEDRPYASAAYQRQLVAVHVTRALTELLAGDVTEEVP